MLHGLRSELNGLLHDLDRKALKQFALGVGLILLLLGAALATFKGLGWLGLSAFGLVFILIGSALPLALKPVYLLWMGVAIILGFFISRLLLTLMYVLVFMPIGFIFRLRRKRLLETEFDQDCTTYWIDRRNQPYDPRQTEKQY